MSIARVAARLWGWKRYWLLPALVFVLLLIGLAMTSDSAPLRPFTYATF